MTIPEMTTIWDLLETEVAQLRSALDDSTLTLEADRDYPEQARNYRIEAWDGPVGRLPFGGFCPGPTLLDRLRFANRVLAHEAELNRKD